MRPLRCVGFHKTRVIFTDHDDALRAYRHTAYFTIVVGQADSISSLEARAKRATKWSIIRALFH